MSFTTTKKNRNKLKPVDFSSKLNECRYIIKDSLMFQDLKTQLHSISGSIKAIRCLAIGSFTEDFPARYQLALLLEIIDYFECTSGISSLLVSIYDPLFTSQDEDFIKKNGSFWSIDETLPPEHFESDSTLFFLPHAPLDLTESVIVKERPKYFLANNIIQHTDRYTALQLNRKYPILSKLINVLDSSQNGTGKANNINGENLYKDDGFTTKVSKKKNRRNRNNNYIFEEPCIDYSLIDSYFHDCKILTNFNNGQHLKDKPWINSFSDLTFHIIE